MSPTTDFTYVATWSAFVYVALCVDVFARVVTGWRVSRSMTTDLARWSDEEVQAVAQALNGSPREDPRLEDPCRGVR